MDETVTYERFKQALVRAAYRALLKREPEDRVLREQHETKIPPEQEGELQYILEAMLQSDEFRMKWEQSRRHITSYSFDPCGHGSRLDIALINSGTRQEVEDRIRMRCQNIYLGEQVALSRCLGRYIIFLDTRDVGFAPHIMIDGYWEMWLTEAMAKIVKPEMHVIDIGANFGYYTLLMADLVGHTGRCTAFEPNPGAAKLLRQSIFINGFGPRTEVFEIALSRAPASNACFYIPHTEPKNARLVEGPDHVDLGDGRVIETKVTSLDLLARQLGKVDFVKVDAEGAEADILIGMRHLLRTQKPKMIFEINCGRGYDAKVVLKELATLYNPLKYLHDDGEIYVVDAETVLRERVGLDWLLYLE